MILIIDKSKKNAMSISNMLFYMGILSRGISPSETFAELSPLYRAILVVSPNTFPSAPQFINKVRLYDSRIPIFAAGDADESYRHMFSHTFHSWNSIVELISNMLERIMLMGLPQPGDYRLMGIDLSCDLAEAKFFTDCGLQFTRTEIMIIRLLFRSYPHSVSAENVLKYSFKDTCPPEISNVRTQISIINKKFRAVTGRNLIEMEVGKGYKIHTPENQAKLI